MKEKAGLAAWLFVWSLWADVKGKTKGNVDPKAVCKRRLHPISSKEKLNDSGIIQFRGDALIIGREYFSEK